jgi:hypothetical protein
MDKTGITISDLEKWNEFSLAQQMGNIGVEVNRVIKYKDSHSARAQINIKNALKFVDLTIQSLIMNNRISAAEEVMQSRRLLWSYFFKNDTRAIEPEKLAEYYLSFYRS